MTDISSFSGQYRWLSNFWPCKVRLDGLEFPSIEHAYQAAKYPEEKRHEFVLCKASQAKAYGRGADLPPDWEAKKIPLMRSLIQQKFAPGSELAVMLLRTGDAGLVEGNTWGDRFWGVCDGKGQNWLGELLMEQRKRLRSNETTGDTAT